MENKLDVARKIINEVDSQMAELFVKRMQAAEMVFEYKKEYGLPILDQKREDAVIARNAAFIEDKTIQGYYIDYLKHLMALSRAYQYQMQNGLKVAYSGGSDTAARIPAGSIFPESTKVSCRDLHTSYDTVISGECDVALLPIEDSYIGEMEESIDLIFSGNLFINGIYELDTPPDVPTSDKKTIHVRSEHITRFAVLSKSRAKSPSLANSVLMFSVMQDSDSLAKAISIIEKNGYKITTLQSRPLKKFPFQDLCYMEIEGIIEIESDANIIRELDLVCERVKVAGTFAPHSRI